MFASNLSPNIGSDTWWDWYKYPTAADGTPDVNGAPDLQGDSGSPDFTATDVFKWLNPVDGAFALGAGAVIGIQDDGFTASASIAFILILPGPVIMLIGKANILSPRISGPAEEANFEAMATYDGNAGTFDLVIEAQYSIPVVLDVQATGELYVDPSVPVWYLAIGKPPHEQRVVARVLDLFESDFYFVVSNTGLVAGFWVGYKNSWSFGPLSASIDAYMAAMGAIQWSPLQLGAGVELHGEVQLSAFGIGLGITADALIEATAPSPWWVYGSFTLELDLPWPLPNVGGTVSLSWGGNGPPPPAPLALSSVDATLSTTAPATATSCWPTAPAARSTPSPRRHRRLRLADVRDPRPAAPGLLGREVPDRPPLAGPDGSAPRSRSGHARICGTRPAGQPLRAQFRPPDRRPGRVRQPVVASPELVSVSPPPSLGADDMSNIDLQPPAVQWCTHHTLVQVALYQFSGRGSRRGARRRHAAVGERVEQCRPAAARRLVDGARPDEEHPGRRDHPQVDAVQRPARGGLHRLLGRRGRGFGTSFSDQGLQFTAGAGVTAAAVGSAGPGVAQGLRFSASQSSAVTISFPCPVVLTGLVGVVVEGGEFPYARPGFRAAASLWTHRWRSGLDRGLHA